MEMIHEVEQLQTYQHPSSLQFPDSYEMPDAICVAGDWVFDWQTDRKMTGVVLKLLTDKAFESFPDAPKDGPWRGMLWFDKSQTSNICALEERLGLHFHGMAYVL